MSDVTQAEIDAAAGKYPIELISEDSLKGASIEELNLLLSHMNQISGQLRAKAHLVHAVLEGKQNARDAAKKAGKFTPESRAALEAHWAEEDRIRNSDMSEADKAAALAKLNYVEDKPPTQHLGGSHITRDDEVKAGGEAKQA